MMMIQQPVASYYHFEINNYDDVDVDEVSLPVVESIFDSVDDLLTKEQAFENDQDLVEQELRKLLEQIESQQQQQQL